MDDLKKFIKNIPDFPKPGVVFKDISPLLLNHNAFQTVTHEICQRYISNRPDKIVGLDARGFIFATAVLVL